MRAFVNTVALMALAAPLGAQGIPDHATFDRVLADHLRGMFVDYAGLESDPAHLESYLRELAATDVATLGGAPQASQLAFWINAYNACALKLVIDHYPIKKAGFPASLVKSLAGVPANSIRQIPDTWKRTFCQVAGKERALDEIEHEIIRPMGDPRIHFAVNCASRSCPVLAPTAYKADSLDLQLDEAVARFLADPGQYRLERGTTPVIHVNKILDWYADDFGGTDGVLEFLLGVIPSDDAAYLRTSSSPRLEYLPYDWTLNDTAVFGTGP